MLRRWVRLGGVIAVLMVGGSLVAGAEPAMATIGGPFCQDLYLPSGATCHSKTEHFYFTEIAGGSTNGLATCVGIDTSPSGGTTLTHMCAASSVDCLATCTGYDGYAYVHNHDATYGDSFSGYLNAHS